VKTRREYADEHRQAVAAKSIAVITDGARVAYCDASMKNGIVRSAVVIAEGWPGLEVTTELTIVPGTKDVNGGELAAIVAAAEFSPDFIITDSWVARETLEKGMYEGIPVVLIPGKTGLVPGHDLAHDLATAARKAAEED
jgi:hypothetical protein